MNNQATGTISKVLDSKQYNSGFSKREFILTISGRYPQHIKFELFKEKINEVTNNDVGRSATISFNLLGNQYKDKYFNTLQAWQVDFEPEEM